MIAADRMGGKGDQQQVTAGEENETSIYLPMPAADNQWGVTERIDSLFHIPSDNIGVAFVVECSVVTVEGEVRKSCRDSTPL